MKPGNDRFRGPLERCIHVLVLAMAVAVAVWLEIGVRELHEVSVQRECELVHFVNLAHVATRSPSKDTERVAARLSLEIAEQRWHTNLGAVRPRVVITDAGPFVKLARIAGPNGEESAR